MRGGFRPLQEDVVESHGGPGLVWYAPESFADFMLSVEWRITNPDDTGVFLRFPPLADTLQPNQAGLRSPNR